MPFGVATSNSSSMRFLSAARAIGASMLIQPLSASISSAPTIRYSWLPSSSSIENHAPK